MTRKQTPRNLARVVVSGIFALGMILALDPVSKNADAQVLNSNNGTGSNGNQDYPSQSVILRSNTTFKTYSVVLVMRSNASGDVNSTSFQVKFYDGSGRPVSSRILYDFTVTDRFLNSIAEDDNQTTDSSGAGQPVIVKFNQPGTVEVTVWVTTQNSTGGVQRESATFDTTVAPEFPIPVVLLSLTAGTLFSIVIARRYYLRSAF